jgi:sugar lactone lactonase YvrE
VWPVAAADPRPRSTLEEEPSIVYSVAFSPDGKTLLVGNMVEKDYWVFAWDGKTLKDTGARVKVNGGAAAIRTADR